MNGRVFCAQILDTTNGLIRVGNADKPKDQLTYESDQLYMIKYGNGEKKFYYSQDSLAGNWLSRDEMWMYMKGENDARKGFRAKGAFFGSVAVGVVAGMTGSFWAPLAPYGFMAFSGIPKIRIRHRTVSDINNLKSEGYILGYERVARQKLKLKSLIGGTVGLLFGYGFYFVFHSQYPETLNIGTSR